MAFFKKNIVLANSKTVGYVTVIRISNTMGIKLTLNEPPVSKAYIGIFSDRDNFLGIIEGIKSEYENLYLDIKSEDNLGVCLFNDKGNLIAHGGKTNIVDKNKIEKYLTDLKISEEQKVDLNKKADFEAEQAKIEAIKLAEVQDTSLTNTKDVAEQEIIIETEKVCAEDYCGMEKLKEKISEVNILKSAEDTSLKDSIESEKTVSSKLEESVNLETENSNVHIIERVEPKTEGINKKSKKGSIDFMENKSSEETVEDLLNKGKSKNYYYSIKEKLDELMIIHPPEEILEEIVPDSKWAMVHYTKTDYYVVGYLKSNNTVTHIAYGLRGVENVPPPKEAKDFCDFITTEKKNGKNYGYYLFFQSADNGEIVKTL